MIWGDMATHVHLIKLSVGTESADDLVEWQEGVSARNAAAGRSARPTHVTRMWPKRADEILAGGSIFWVIKGQVLARQRVLGFEPRDGANGIRRCAIVLDPEMIRTLPQPRRPFQGWRYLRPEEAPADLRPGGASLPPGLMAGLAEIGVL